MTTPNNPKIYHIVHIDRLISIIDDGFLLSDAQMTIGEKTGTPIGMETIKHRRLNEYRLASFPDLYVGQCVPFYFCPRSVMLYLLYRGNYPGLTYRGGQEPIIHLEADLLSTVAWANENNVRWAFTFSNAGSGYFEDRNDLNQLNEIDWDAVQAQDWRGKKEGKQAEFLIENKFPWRLIKRIGTFSDYYARAAIIAMRQLTDKPSVEICREWYYP